LHSWDIEIDLGRIKAKRMLVLVVVELLARRRTSSIYVAMYKIKVCSLIINHRSYVNVASTTIISKMNLCIIKHNSLIGCKY
jgi:hypothetical protein